MDEYKTRLSDYLTAMVREELAKYDSGFTDEMNAERGKNAEVLGYKLSGKSDVNEAEKKWTDYGNHFKQLSLGFKQVPFWKKLNKNQKEAISIALIMGGNMTGAVEEIEKIKKGLSKDKKVKNALRVANESIDETKERDYKAEYKKYGSSTKAKKYRAELNQYNRKKGTYGNGDGKDASHKGGKIVGFEKESTNRGRAEKSRLKKESVNEGTFGKYDTGAAFKGNGLTIYDRNQSQGGDFKNIAHISEDGKLTIWDKNIKKEPKLMQSLKKISQEFKTSFKESVNEAYGDLNDNGFKKVRKYNTITIKLVKKLENAVRRSEGKDAVKWIRGLYDAVGIMYDTIGHKMYYESINESDLGLTYKKGKTITVKHKKSGKELVIIDKPNVKREYEKIGFYAESVNEKISREEWAQYPKYARKLKPYMQRLLKVRLKVRVIKQANHNPWIEVRVARFGKDTIPNDFRVKVAKSIGARSVRDWDNVNYGGIRVNSIDLKYDQWVKLTGDLK